jgi:cell division protein FtsX
MYENKHIILNIQDLSQANNLHQQEQRVVNIIKLSNFIQVLCLVLVGVLAAVILSFAVFFLRGIFTAFRKDIQVKKLMGATKSQIIQPFLWSIVYAIIGGFIISLWLTVGSLAIFDYYMVQVFERSVMEYVQGHWLQIGGAFLAELVGIIGLLTMISYHFISSLHKKLR